MPARLHPGVYVEEVPSGARSIEAVGTSTAIFVGETERGPITPTLIKGTGDFERLFGGYERHAAGGGSAKVITRYAVDSFFQNGGTTAYVLRAHTGSPATAARAPLVSAASPGAWGNNLRVVYTASSDGDDSRFRVFVVYQAPGLRPPRIVETWDRLSNKITDDSFMPEVLKRSALIRSSAAPDFTLPTLDLPPETVLTPAVVIAAGANLSGGSGGDSALAASGYASLLPLLDGITDASLLVVPTPIGANADDTRTIAGGALAYAEVRPRQDLFCIADLPRFASAGPSAYVSDARVFLLGSSAPDPVIPALSPKTTFGAVFGPWVEVADPVGVGHDPTVFVGPSGFVAGLFARIDQRRGVWKAPAGTEAALLGARRPEHHLLDAHQDSLNPLGINAIRVIPAGGNVVWGARTLVPASEWRYVPVRRTAIMIRTSIYNSIQWAVFEPNNETLWSSLRLSIGAFMDQLFRQGAFAGATAKEGYFVKCDAETTTADERAAGIVNVWVGFAPLRPAEFVVVKLSQMTSQKA